MINKRDKKAMHWFRKFYPKLRQKLNRKPTQSEISAYMVGYLDGVVNTNSMWKKLLNSVYLIPKND